MSKRISYTIWGTEKNKNNWLEWYNDVCKLFNEMSYKLTHFGISSSSFQGDNILTISRKEKKLIEVLQNGEIPNWMECYSLKKDYKTAMFNFDIFCTRTNSFITIVIREYDSSIEDEKKFIDFEKKYYNLEYGEKYMTSDKEVPMIYAATKNSSNLKTYKKIETIS